MTPPKRKVKVKCPKCGVTLKLALPAGATPGNCTRCLLEHAQIVRLVVVVPDLDGRR